MTDEISDVYLAGLIVEFVYKKSNKLPTNSTTVKEWEDKNTVTKEDIYDRFKNNNISKDMIDKILPELEQLFGQRKSDDYKLIGYFFA